MAVFFPKYVHKNIEKHLWFFEKEKWEAIDFQANIH